MDREKCMATIRMWAERGIPEVKLTESDVRSLMHFIEGEIQKEMDVVLPACERALREEARLRAALKNIADAEPSLRDQTPCWAEWALDGKDINGEPVHPPTSEKDPR